ncbi:MAG: hypothetical protein KGH75_01185 [Rhodospirillales bacterium]|nr:hypothetical protein [Rhodospirillales bacterium]
MALMTFDIPDGMTAQVIVGPPEAFARREPLQLSYEAVQMEARPRPRRRWFLMSSGAIALLLVGMILGGSLKWHNSANAETASLAPPPVPAPDQGPPPATTAFPAQAPSVPPAPPSPSLAATSVGAPPAAAPAPSGQMPPDLAADLKAQPQVEPAPGQAPGQGNAPPPQNAFGLGG